MMQSVPFGRWNISLDSERSSHERSYIARLVHGVAYPQWDIDVAIYNRFIERGDRVLDAGANIGLTALQALLSGASEVICIEPVSELAERIQNIKEPAITVIQNALGDQTGFADLVISESHDQGSTMLPQVVSMFRYIFGEELRRERVPMTTIDALTSTHGPLDFWKLDIEGAEIMALEGAAATLSKTPPRVIVAELWEPFRDGFLAACNRTHPFAYRALRDPKTFELVLLPSAEGDARYTEFVDNSPMYVCLQQAL